MKSRVLPEQRAKYLRLHDEIPQAVIEEYKSAGIQKVSCFLDGYDLYVYTEYDDTPENAEKMKNLPASEAFTKRLKPVKDPAFPPTEIEEVFHLE